MIALSPYSLQEVPVEFWLRIPNRSTSSVSSLGMSLWDLKYVSSCLMANACSLRAGLILSVLNAYHAMTPLFSRALAQTQSACASIYGPTGSERPLSNRPPIGHPMLQDFVAAPGQPAAIGMNVPGQFDSNTLKCQTFRTWHM